MSQRRQDYNHSFSNFPKLKKGKYWNQIPASDFELFTHWSGDWNPKISAIIEAFWREPQGDPIQRGGSSIMIASSHGGRRNWNWYWNATSLLMKPPPCFIVQKTSPTNQAEIEKWWQNFFRTFAIFSGISKEKFNFFCTSGSFHAIFTKEMSANWFWPIVAWLDLALVTTRDWGVF